MPTKYFDSTGLFKVDKSCKGDCLIKKITNEVRQAYRNLVAGITNPKLKKCVEKRCKNATIRCKNGTEGGCKPDKPGDYANGYNVHISLFGVSLGASKKIYLCLDSASPNVNYGITAIHEWGHSCGWGNPRIESHPRGSGIPKQNGGVY